MTSNLKTAADDDERSYWDRHAAKYDKTMGPLGKPLPRMVQLVGEAVSNKAKVLEVAAGTGLVTPELARRARKVIATDYSPAMVDRLHKRVAREKLTNVECHQADIYSLPWPPASFDAVVAANVLHLVPDLAGALASLVRMLRRGGALVVPTFCHDQSLTSRVVSRFLALTGFPGHRRLSDRSLAEALMHAGIEIRRTELLPGLLPIGYVEGTPRSSSDAESQACAAFESQGAAGS